MTRTLISEEELIQVLNTGTEEAFDLLYKNYSAAIFGSILKIVQNKELAEDLTQESFIKIWNNFESKSKVSFTTRNLFERGESIRKIKNCGLASLIPRI